MAVGAAPDLPDWFLEMTPVDFTSRVVVEFAKDISLCMGKIFHIIQVSVSFFFLFFEGQREREKERERERERDDDDDVFNPRDKVMSKGYLAVMSCMK